MLSTLLRFSIYRARTVVILAAALIVHAGVQLSKTGIDIFPEFSPSRVVIQTEAEGLTAEQTETLITLRIEKALAGTIGLETLRSESIQGLSVVTALFKEGSDRYRTRQAVNERLMRVTQDLPPGTAQPVMLPLSSSSATVMTLGVTSPSKTLMDLRDLVDYTLIPRLMAIPGIADVNVFGGEVRQLQIQPDIDRLRQHGLSIQSLLDAASDATGMAGAGFIETNNQRISLKFGGLPTTPDDLADLVVGREGGRHLHLGEVATLKIAPKPAIGVAAIGGEPGIVLMLIGQYGASTLTTAKDAESVIAPLKLLLQKQNVTLHTHLFRPADYIERAIENLTGHLLIGAALVMMVLYVFLGNVRMALIPALAIPLSLLLALQILLWMGIQLNIMVLGGLAIALGEVVDDAIIDTENISRRTRELATPIAQSVLLKTIYKASMEVRSSVIYASFIVVLAFTPLLFLEGVTGRLFAPLGVAYGVAILCSLIIALTVTPALCVLTLSRAQEHPNQSAERRLGRLISSYRALLHRLALSSLRWMYWPLGGSLILMAGLPLLGGDFLPKLREGHFIVHTSTLPGTSLEETLRAGTRLVHSFLAMEGVESVSQWAGRAERGADTYGSHYSEYEIRLKPTDGDGEDRILRSLRKVLTSFPGLVHEANTFLTERIEETVSGYTAPVVVHLLGQNLEQLDETAKNLLQRVRSIPGARDVQLRSPSGTPMAEIRLNLPDLAANGLRPLELTRTLQATLRGTTVGQYFLDNRTIDVAVILAKAERERLEALEQLPLLSADGHFIELGEVASVTQSTGRYNILHRNGQRVQTLTASVEGRDLDSFYRDLRTEVFESIDYPPGVVPELAGSIRTQAEARMQLIVNALLAGTLVLVLLGYAIGRGSNLVLTLINLPVAMAGGVLGALVSGSSLSVGSMVGFVTLFGITLRHLIMLIAHYRHLTEDEGRDWRLETAIQGAIDRLPSILMTALATTLALLPIALDSDHAGREIMGPMAAVIIGGLTTSTLLSLILIPLLFARFGRFSSRVQP